MKVPFEPGLLHPRHWLTWLGVALLTLGWMLPARLRNALVAKVAQITYRATAKQNQTARVNLILCFPDWSDERREIFLRASYRCYLQVLSQLPLAWFGGERSLRRSVHLNNLTELDDLQQKGQPVVLMFSHSMALDFAGIRLSLDYPMQGIYNPFNNAVIDWLFRRGRLRHGNSLTARGSGLRTVLKQLKQGYMLVYLSDEDYGVDGSVFAPLFGQPKATLTMLPRIVRHSGAAVVPVYAHYEATSDHFEVTLLPSLIDFPKVDEVANALTMNQAIERSILLCPEQYLWKLRLFRTNPEGDRSIYGRVRDGELNL